MWKLKLILFIVVVANYDIKGLSVKNKLKWYSTASPEDIRNKQIELTKLYMNTSVDPCDDFYEYSCGNWTPVGEVSRYGDVRDVLEQNIQNTLKELIEESYEDCDPNEQALKIFYKSCMNTNLISERGKQLALDFLKKLNGWPMIDSKSSAENIDWLELSAEMAVYGENHILQASFEEVDNTTQEDVFRLMPLYHFSHDYEDILWNNVTTFLFGETLSTSIVDEIKRFEEAFRDIVSMYYSGNAITVTLAELLIEEPVIDWERYLSILLEKRIYPSQKIKVSMKWLKGIATLLANTPSRIIANDILYRTMIYMVGPLIIPDLLSSRTRDEYCLDTIQEYFKKSLNKIFIQKYLNESAKNYAIEVSEGIRESFSKFIDNISWIDAPTKRIAQEKAKGIQVYLEPRAKDLDVILDYPELKLHQYFENTMKVRKHNLKTEVMTPEILTYIHDQSKLDSYYEEVNATAGNLYLPAGILQPPFYNQYFPKWSNYGGIGYEIGYQITVEYTRYIAYGNTEIWRSPESFQEYRNRANCFKHRISDKLNKNGGLKFAYEAYKQWLSYHENSDETNLNPVHNLTGEQLFFLSFAQKQCNGEGFAFNVISTLTNSAEFAKEFQCPVGSAMNPASKCQF